MGVSRRRRAASATSSGCSIGIRWPAGVGSTRRGAHRGGERLVARAREVPARGPEPERRRREARRPGVEVERLALLEDGRLDRARALELDAAVAALAEPVEHVEVEGRGREVREERALGEPGAGLGCGSASRSPAARGVHHARSTCCARSGLRSASGRRRHRVEPAGAARTARAARLRRRAGWCRRTSARCRARAGDRRARPAARPRPRGRARTRATRRRADLRAATSRRGRARPSRRRGARRASSAATSAHIPLQKPFAWWASASGPAPPEVEERDLDAPLGEREPPRRRGREERAGFGGRCHAACRSPSEGARRVAAARAAERARYPPGSVQPLSERVRAHLARHPRLAAPLDDHRHAAVAVVLSPDAERAPLLRADAPRRGAPPPRRPVGAAGRSARPGRDARATPRSASAPRRSGSRSPAARARPPRRLPDALGLRDHAGRGVERAPGRARARPEGGGRDPPRARSPSSSGPACRTCAASPRASAR